MRSILPGGDHSVLSFERLHRDEGRTPRSSQTQQVYCLSSAEEHVSDWEIRFLFHNMSRQDPATGSLGQQLDILLQEAPTKRTPKGLRNQRIVATIRASLRKALGPGNSSPSRSPGIKRPLCQTGPDSRRLVGRQHYDPRSYWLHSFHRCCCVLGTQRDGDRDVAM